jgi:hypothetical protein
MTDDTPSPGLAKLFIVHCNETISTPAREPAFPQLRPPQPQWKVLTRIGRRRRRGKPQPKYPA